MKTKLNTLRAEGWNKIRWCGPTALAIITGQSLEYCHNLLADIEYKHPRYLKGVSNFSMLRALAIMNYRLGYRSEASGMTLRKYMEEVQHCRDHRSVMLINVTDHYVVIHRGMVSDSWHPTPVPVREHRAWRKRIAQAYVVTPVTPRPSA